MERIEVDFSKRLVTCDGQIIAGAYQQINLPNVDATKFLSAELLLGEQNRYTQVATSGGIEYATAFSDVMRDSLTKAVPMLEKRRYPGPWHEAAVKAGYKFECCTDGSSYEALVMSWTDDDVRIPSERDLKGYLENGAAEAAEPIPGGEPVSAPEPTAEPEQVKKKRKGFWARLFG